MHRLGHLKYTTLDTHFSFPVFIIYKTHTKREKKECTVVDIRKLNNLVFPDAYPFPLQFGIIIIIQECTNLAILDATLFFYQWLLHPNYWYMFIVVTYCKQKIFQILIMGYINLIAHVQRKINNILWEIEEWACAYVDNIVCKKKSLADFFTKLCVLFDIFLYYNILIEPTKSYLN